MHRRHNANVIGPMAATLRYRRGWTQEQAVAKLQGLGCYMTRDILANIETKGSSVTDKVIEFLAELYDVEVGDLFPAKRHFSGRIVGLGQPIVTRRHCRRRRRRSPNRKLAVKKRS